MKPYQQNPCFLQNQHLMESCEPETILVSFINTRCITSCPIPSILYNLSQFLLGRLEFFLKSLENSMVLASQEKMLKVQTTLKHNVQMYYFSLQYATFLEIELKLGSHFRLSKMKYQSIIQCVPAKCKSLRCCESILLQVCET